MLVKFGSFPQDLGSINQMNPKHLRWFQWQILQENQDCLPITKILWGFGCYFLYNVALKRGDVNQNFYQVTGSSRILVLKRNQMHKLDRLPNSPKCYQSNGNEFGRLDIWHSKSGLVLHNLATFNSRNLGHQKAQNSLHFILSIHWNRMKGLMVIQWSMRKNIALNPTVRIIYNTMTNAKGWNEPNVFLWLKYILDDWKSLQC